MIFLFFDSSLVNTCCENAEIQDKYLGYLGKKYPDKLAEGFREKVNQSAHIDFGGSIWVGKENETIDLGGGFSTDCWNQDLLLEYLKDTPKEFGYRFPIMQGLMIISEETRERFLNILDTPEIKDKTKKMLEAM